MVENLLKPDTLCCDSAALFPVYQPGASFKIGRFSVSPVPTTLLSVALSQPLPQSSDEQADESSVSSDESQENPPSKPAPFPLFLKKNFPGKKPLNASSKTKFKSTKNSAKKGRTQSYSELQKQACIKAYFSRDVSGPMNIGDQSQDAL